MSVLDANFASPEIYAPFQSTASSAWADHARSALTTVPVPPQTNEISPQRVLSSSQCTTTQNLPALSGGESIWSKLGFTSPDVLAFDQGAPSRAESKLGKFWDDIKDILGQSDTVNDRLKKAVESKLTPEERTQLVKQEKQFHKKQMQSLRTGLGWGMEAPDLFDYPLIGKRDHMLRDAEENICKEVRSRMTVAEKKELDQQFMQYAEAIRACRESSVFKPRPQLGKAIQDFYQNVADSVENFGRQEAA